MAEDGDDSAAATLRAAAGELRETLDGIRATARGLSGDLADGLKAAVVEGERLDDVLGGLSERLSGRFLDLSLAPLEGVVARGLAAAVAPTIAADTGGMQRTGAMPETAGAQRGGGVSIALNVTTPDVEGFRRSEAQVTAVLARAVGRGRRGL